MLLCSGLVTGGHGRTHGLALVEALGVGSARRHAPDAIAHADVVVNDLVDEADDER